MRWNGLEKGELINNAKERRWFAHRQGLFAGGGGSVSNHDWFRHSHHRRQPLQGFRQAIHARPIDSATTAPEATGGLVPAYPIGVLFPVLAVEFRSRRKIVYPPPDRQVQQRIVVTVHLLELVPCYHHHILCIDVFLDFHRFLHTEQHGYHRQLVTMQSLEPEQHQMGVNLQLPPHGALGTDGSSTAQDVREDVERWGRSGGGGCHSWRERDRLEEGGRPDLSMVFCDMASLFASLSPPPAKTAENGTGTYLRGFLRNS
jgi:hypothetical protein